MDFWKTHALLSCLPTTVLLALDSVKVLGLCSFWSYCNLVNFVLNQKKSKVFKN